MTRRFKITAGFRLLLLFAAALCGLFVIAPMAVCFTSPHWERTVPLFSLLAAPFCLGGWYCLAAYRRTKDVFEVNEAGITRVSPDGTKFRVLWTDITAILPREKMGRLDVFDRSARPVMRLEYQLNDFDLLRSLVYEKTQTFLDQQIRRDTFTRNAFFFFSWCFIVVLGILIAWVVWIQSHILGWIAATPTAYLLFDFLRRPWRVELEPDAIRLRSFLRTQRLPYTAIREINLENRRTDEGDLYAAVVLSLKDGPQVELTQFREGSLVLYHALQKALETNTPSGRKR